MTILASELRAFQSQTINDATTNGGRISFNQITSGGLQNVFPHVFAAERTSGSTKRRKLFFRCINDADETLFSPSVRMHAPTPGGDRCYFHIGSQRDTAVDITGSERKYGAGLLFSPVSASATSLVVNVEDASLTGIFANGDTIRITDKLTPTSLTGNEEDRTINGAPVVSGTHVTLTLSAGLANGYAAGAFVGSCYHPATDLACTVTNWTDTGAGTYNEAANPVLCDNIGTAEQTWTLTFSSATAYTVSGDTVGSVGSGTISADFIPINSAVSKPYLTLKSAGFGGTWAAGNTIVFQTHPPAIPIWETSVVPVGCPSLAGNGVTLVLEGETA